MKIMYVITSLNLGGAETQVLRMCKNMKEKAHDVCLVLMVDAQSDDILNKVKEHSIRCYSLHMKRGKASLKAYIHFLSVIKKEKPDVVHSHMIHANLLLRASAPFIKHTKKINTIHGEEEYLGRRKQIYRITDSLTDYTVCCGKNLYEQAKEYKIVSFRKLKYICNGLDTGEYLFDQRARLEKRISLQIDDEFVWITVGRLSEVKNQKYLIMEFKRIMDVDSNAKLVIVGDGHLMDDLKQLSERSGLGKNVIFTGKRSDISELLSCADGFVLASVHEGLPLSLQEAGAVGIPLVSTDVGGCNEVIVEGKNGYLCESNEPGALSQAMLKVMQKNSEERALMGKMSREIIVEKFDITNVMKEWEELYV